MRPHERVHFADSSRHAAYSEYTDLRFSISISAKAEGKFETFDRANGPSPGSGLYFCCSAV